MYIFPRFFIFILFLFSFGILSLLLGQDVNGDLLNYHFYDGFAAFHHRLGFDIAPALMQTYLNPFFDAINYLCIALQKPYLSSFLLGIFSGAAGFFLYLIAEILFADVSRENRIIYSLLAVMIGITGADSVSLTGTTTNDTKVTLMVLTALYCLLKACVTTNGQHKIRYIIVAGLIAGLVLGFKLVAACYVIGLAGAFWFANVGSNRLFLLTILLGFLLGNGYWMIVLYKNFHSPLYPLYNNIFHSPYAPAMTFNMPSSGMKRGFMDYLLMPFYLARSGNTFISEAPMRDFRLSLVFLLAITCILKSCLKKNTDRSTQVWQLAATFFIVSYIVWLVVLTNFRYMLPLEILSGLMMVYFLRQIIATNYSIQIFLVFIVLLLGATTNYPNWGRLAFGNNYFSVKTPALPDNAEVVFATQPLAYVIPFFSHSINFIGMPYVELGVDELKQDTSRKLFTTVIEQLVRDTKMKPVYLMGFQQQDKNKIRTLKILKQYGLTEDTSHCEKFETNIGNKLEICPLVMDLKR
jgi:hypothetical protein